MVTLTEGRLVYEARFPREGHHPLPRLASKPGKNISVGFRTREIEFQRRFDTGDNIAAGGGFGGPAGDYGQSGYGRGYDGGRTRSSGFNAGNLQPIEEWTKITLATAPAVLAPSSAP